MPVVRPHQLADYSTMSSLVLLCLLAVARAADYDWDDITVLDDYVHRDDGAWTWEEVGAYTYNATNCTTYVFNMTSQIYQTEDMVDKSLWWHWVGVSIPDNILYYDFAAMLVNGGSNRLGSTPPGFESLENVATCALATATRATVGYVSQVPNQPIVFSNDESGRSRSEDSLIAWTWRTFIDQIIANETSNPPDPEVLLRMPMTKSAKRGMDTIAAVAAEKVGANIDRFCITGASKRGWTTYSVAAVDRRVKIMAPIVFSLLNAQETIMHHFQSMDGGYSFALAPYYNEGLTEHLLDDDLIAPLMEVEDLFSYRRRFTNMPHLQIVATGDEFFLCTDSHYWWDQFPSKKWMMMNQNAEHALVPAYIRIAETVVSYVVAYLEDWTMPELEWEMDDYEDGTGYIQLITYPPAVNVTGWRSVTNENNTRRDWRLVEGYPEQQLHPVWWYRNQLELTDMSNETHGIYLAETSVTEEEEGEWVGFFIQGIWTGPTGLRLSLTTEVNVIQSDVFPRGPCESNDECYGILV